MSHRVHFYPRVLTSFAVLTLPDHISIRTPSPTPTNFVSDIRPNLELRSLFSPSFLTMANREASYFKGCLDNGTSHVRESEAHSHLPGYQSQVSARDICDPPSDFAAIAGHSDSFLMQILVEGAYSGLELLIYVERLTKRMLPAVHNFIQSIQVTTETISMKAYEPFFHPKMSQLLHKQRFDTQILHMIIYRLINDDDIPRILKHPSDNTDKLFRVGIVYFLSLDAHLIVEMLGSVPVLLRPALEDNLFCAAIELRAIGVVEAMLKRGFNLNREFSFIGRPSYPLEQSWNNLDSALMHILLKFGADPDLFAKRILSNFRWMHAIGHNERKSVTAAVEMILVHLQTGAKLHRDSELFLLCTCEPDILSSLVSKFFVLDYEQFVTEDGLVSIIERPVWDDSIPTLLAEILSQLHPDASNDKPKLSRALTEALYKASQYRRAEVIELLLAKGVQISVRCLISSAYNQDYPLFERFLGLGADPNRVSSPIEEFEAYRFSRVYRSKRQMVTALSICIEKLFKEGLQLLEQKGFVDKACQEAMSFVVALDAAYCAKNLSLVNYLMSHKKENWVENRTKDSIKSRINTIGHGAMTFAVECGEESLVRQLLALGVDDHPDALCLAIRKGFWTISGLLLDFHGDLSPGSDKVSIEANALFEATKSNDQEFIRALYSRYYVRIGNNGVLGTSWVGDYLHTDVTTRIDQIDDRKWISTPLAAAILMGDQSIINLAFNLSTQFEYRHKAPSTGYFSSTITGLAACALKRDIPMVQSFLARGLDPFDNNAVYIATVLGEEEMVNILLSAFAQRYPLGAKDFASDALCWAVCAGMTQLIPVLNTPENICTGVYLKNLPTTVERQVYPTSALEEAIFRDSKDPQTTQILPLLLQSPKVLEAIVHHEKDFPQCSALLLAIKFDSLRIVKMLHSVGTNLSSPARLGRSRTPLQAAAESGNMEIVEYLLQQGVDSNEAPAVKRGATALQLAAMKGFLGVAAILIEYGADINAPPALQDGRTCFEGAAEHGRVEMMIYLFQNKADLLSNNKHQYFRAVSFAEKNKRWGAKALAEEMLETALKDEEARQTTSEVPHIFETEFIETATTHQVLHNSESEISEIATPSMDEFFDFSSLE